MYEIAPPYLVVLINPEYKHKCTPDLITIPHYFLEVNVMITITITFGQNKNDYNYNTF